MTSKKLRPLQIETKFFMGKGVPSSLLLSLQKVEYILGWINKVLCICIKFLLALMHCSSTWMTFSCTTWLKTEVHGKFLFLTLLTKGRNKTLKCLLLLTIRWKLLRGKRKLQGWKKTKLTRKMDDMCEEAVVEVEFFHHYILQVKLWNTFPGLSLLIWVLENL